MLVSTSSLANSYFLFQLSLLIFQKSLASNGFLFGSVSRFTIYTTVGMRRHAPTFMLFMICRRFNIID